MNFTYLPLKHTLEYSLLDAVYVGEVLHHTAENRHESPKMIINRENQYSMDVNTQFTDRFFDIIRFDNEKVY